MSFNHDPWQRASSPERSPAQQLIDSIDSVAERGIPTTGHSEMHKIQERIGFIPQRDENLDPTVYLAHAHQPGSRTIGYAYRRKPGSLVSAVELDKEMLQGSSSVLFITVHPDKTMTESVYYQRDDTTKCGIMSIYIKPRLAQEMCCSVT